MTHRRVCFPVYINVYQAPEILCGNRRELFVPNGSFISVGNVFPMLKVKQLSLLAFPVRLNTVTPLPLPSRSRAWEEGCAPAENFRFFAYETVHLGAFTNAKTFVLKIHDLTTHMEREFP